MAKRKSRKRGLGGTKPHHRRRAEELLPHAMHDAVMAYNHASDGWCRLAVETLGAAREKYGRFMEHAIDASKSPEVASDVRMHKGWPRQENIRKEIDRAESQVKDRCLRATGGR